MRKRLPASTTSRRLAHEAADNDSIGRQQGRVADSERQAAVDGAVLGFVGGASGSVGAEKVQSRNGGQGVGVDVHWANGDGDSPVGAVIVRAPCDVSMTTVAAGGVEVHGAAVARAAAERTAKDVARIVALFGRQQMSWLWLGPNVLAASPQPPERRSGGEHEQHTNSTREHENTRKYARTIPTPADLFNPAGIGGVPAVPAVDSRPTTFRSAFSVQACISPTPHQDFYNAHSRWHPSC
ncbi:hypothetical protein CIB48_g103 [Xylaria polymorpha]|nr:hypothetical protein CIB48_g103 [Xylaria polymorpha]